MANNPYVNKVQLANGTTLMDISDTTAVASDVAQGKYFYTADGAKVQGTSSGGGGGGGIVISDTTDAAGGTVRTITGVTISGTKTINQNGTGIDVTSYEAVDVDVGISIVDEANATGTTAVVTGDGGGGGGGATQHSIYFEFSDSTNTTIPVYYDNSLISTMITAYTPTTYGAKTVTLAQLDGVTWYQPANIPIGVELIDYTKLTSDTAINEDGQAISQQWYYATDYTEVDPSMTFSYASAYWFYIGVYDANKTFLRSIYVYTDGTVNPSDSNIGNGTLSGNKLTGAKYVRLCSTHQSSPYLSLIRTA